MRQKNEAWMKRAEDLVKRVEDLTNENEFLKRKLERKGSRGNSTEKEGEGNGGERNGKI